jgi:hypothetical protein
MLGVGHDAVAVRYKPGPLRALLKIRLRAKLAVARGFAMSAFGESMGP